MSSSKSKGFDFVVEWFLQETPAEAKNLFKEIVFKLLERFVGLMSDLDQSEPEGRQQIAAFLERMATGDFISCTSGCYRYWPLYFYVEDRTGNQSGLAKSI